MPALSEYINVHGTAFDLLKKKGYQVWTKPDSELVHCEKDGWEFAAESPTTLLGLIAIYEDRVPTKYEAYWWRTSVTDYDQIPAKPTPFTPVYGRADPIAVRFQLPMGPEIVWQHWTENARLEKWLTLKAVVEPRQGGSYELFWEPENPDRNSTLGCKITIYEPPTKLGFEWRGPPQYADLMNTQPFPTYVTFSFLAVGSSTEVSFEHSGWGASQEWQAARAWQERAWRGAFEQLRELVSPS